jgi:phenylacetaldehyde dehydrogenase
VARRAFDGPWRKSVTPSERGRMIWKLADLLEQHVKEFAQLEALDNGKPVTVARARSRPISSPAPTPRWSRPS